MKVDSVKMMKTKPFCIIIANGEEYKLNNDLVYKYKIEKNSEFSQVLWNDIIKENQLMTAKRKAYELIQNNPKSENKIRERLKKEKYDSEIIEKTITFLYNFDLLNDEEFSKKYIHDYLLKKKAGKYKLINKLQENGIKYDLALKVTNNLIDDELELKMINQILETEKKFDILDKNKIFRMLLNRGFNSEIIRKIID